MPDLLGATRRFVVSWRADLALGIVLAGWSLWALVAAAADGHQHWTALACLTPFCAAVAARQRWPASATVTAGLALAAIRPLGQAGFFSHWLSLPFVMTPFLFCYSAGSLAPLATGLISVLVLTAGLNILPGPMNPLVEMITIGPWLTGRIARSRRSLADQLRRRNAELQAEQEHYARESVRYERARISAELHDIVAHCLSVMVIQASAGQRAADADREAMTRALAGVAEAATEAQEEVGRLVDLLSGGLPGAPSPDLGMVGELVSRAASTGLTVTCRVEGTGADLAPAGSQVAYRVVQEALTNALKHAPGAPVTITISGQGTNVTIGVANPAPALALAPAGLAGSGGRVGLAAMRDRVTACGGTLTAGPITGGGWQVLAVLPSGLATPTTSR